MWKIVATGIGTEYFQADLDIAGAISKYNINTQNGKIQIKTNKEAICTIYDDLYDFANNEPSFEPHIQKLQILTKLFHLSKPYDYNFVIATNKKAAPFANDGDILVIIRETFPKDNTLLVLKVNDEILVKYCRINPFNKNIKLFSTNNDFANIKLSQNELFNIEFLEHVVNILVFDNIHPSFILS